MLLYNFIEMKVDHAFEHILNFFAEEPETAHLAWFLIIKKRVPTHFRTREFNILVRIAKIKKIQPLKFVPYNMSDYSKAMVRIKKVFNWLYRFWFRKAKENLSLLFIDKLSMRNSIFRLTETNLILSKEYAILLNLIEEWSALTYKQFY